jgi:hypothetical protein
MLIGEVITLVHEECLQMSGDDNGEIERIHQSLEGEFPFLDLFQG